MSVAHVVVDWKQMTEAQRADALRERFDALAKERDPRHRDDPLMLRMRRVTSWVTSAAQEGRDDDTAFMCYWVAFNALYGDDTGLIKLEETERATYRRCIEKIADTGPLVLYRELDEALGEEEIRALVNDRYVLAPYWHSAGWQRALREDAQRLDSALQWKNTKEVLCLVFDRLYVLRNQLLHGGATWGSSINRAEVAMGRRFAAFLIPLLADRVLDNPDLDWGKPYYPPSNQTWRNSDA